MINIKRYLKRKNRTNKRIKELNEELDLAINNANKYKKLYNKARKEIRESNEKIKFLMERENKLQKIEQLFENGTVDLDKLTKIVKGI